MQILKIDNGNGYFRISKTESWKQINEIDKDSLFKLLDIFLTSEVEMDIPSDDRLSNQAQRIIYRSIYDKLDLLKESKNKFKDESERLYLGALQKYSDLGVLG